MGGRPRMCHLKRGEHQTGIVNAEETAAHLTGDCLDVARPPRSAASFVRRATSLLSLTPNYLQVGRCSAPMPIWTMRGLSMPATPTYLNTRLSISRLRASWITICLPPVSRGQNADAWGCFDESALKVKSTPVLVK